MTLSKKEVEIDSMNNLFSVATPSSINQNYWAFLVGINKYLFNPNLYFSVNDVKALEKILRQLRYTVLSMHDGVDKNGVYEKPEDYRPTKTLILNQLRTFCQKPDEGDLLWVYFACHGISKEDKNFILAYDTDQDNLENSGLLFTEIEDIVKSSRASKKIIMLDACHIGYAGRDKSTRSIAQEEFIKLAYEETKGYCLISASDKDEKAHEWEEANHGVFTYFLLRGLGRKEAAKSDNKYVTVQDMVDYVVANVKGWTDQWNKPPQKPRIFNIADGGIILADYEGVGSLDPVVKDVASIKATTVERGITKVVYAPPDIQISRTKEWVHKYLLPPQSRREQVTSVVISPDGKKLLSASRNYMVKVWELDTGELLDSFSIVRSRFLRETDSDVALAISSDGKTVVCGNRISSYITLYNLHRKEKTFKEINNDKGTDAIVLNSNERQIITAHVDYGTINVRHWGNDTLLYSRQREYSWCLALSPSEAIFASASNNKTIKLWNISTGEQVFSSKELPQIKSLAFSPDGKILASGHTDKKIRLWDTSTKKQLNSLEGHSDEVRAISISSSNVLASGSKAQTINRMREQTIKLWNLSSGELLPRLLPEQTVQINSLTFSPDGNYLVSGAEDGTINVWEARG